MPPNHPNFTNDLSFLSSEPFEIVAQSGKRFFIHSDILTTQFEQLDDTGTRKRMDLSNWDDDTVEQFAQFLYVGEYKVPDTTPGVSHEQSHGEEWVDIEGMGKLCGGDKPDLGQGQIAQEGRADVNLLLVHAKVYALAQCKEIGTLQEVALERLKMALEGIDRQMLEEASKVTTDIIELLRYLYSNKDSQPDRMAPGGSMLDLMSTFVATHFEKLITREGIVLLLREKGDLTVRSMEMVARRISGVEEKLCDAERQIADFKGRIGTLERKLRELEASNTESLLSQAIGVDRLWEIENQERWSEYQAYASDMCKLWEAGGETFTPESDEANQGAASLKDDVQLLEAQVEWFDSACPGKMREFESKSSEKIKEFEAADATKKKEYETLSIQWLKTFIKVIELRLMWFKNNHTEAEALAFRPKPIKPEEQEEVTLLLQEAFKHEAAEIQQLHMTLLFLGREIRYFKKNLSEEFKAANAATIRGFKSAKAAKKKGSEIASLARIRWLEDQKDWLEVKVKWFKAVCPVQAQQWEDEH